MEGPGIKEKRKAMEQTLTGKTKYNLASFFFNITTLCSPGQILTLVIKLLQNFLNDNSKNCQEVYLINVNIIVSCIMIYGNVFCFSPVTNSVSEECTN